MPRRGRGWEQRPRREEEARAGAGKGGRAIRPIGGRQGGCGEERHEEEASTAGPEASAAVPLQGAGIGGESERNGGLGTKN